MTSDEQNRFHSSLVNAFMKAERWRQVEEIFHAALERGAERRAAFLAETCAGDDSLRREVESLLAYEDRAEGFIESSALEVAAQMARGPGATVAAGQTVNQYRVISPLGAGGMGEVYLASDTRLGRRVALKFLPALLTREKGHLRRFEQEARAVAALSHPNVCTIHEVVETGEGRHCIVMEYVEGVTLRERMAGGRIEVGEALDAAIQIASALEAAHAAGVVHRDIKPENIMIRRDGYVKVLDFGLAKLTEKESETAGSEGETPALGPKTSPGTVLGTVAYMSPEQARGLEVDTRTDIWSFGVVLYELVTGGAPFDGGTPSDSIASILKTEPPTLSHYAPGVPHELERIVTKALRKERDERYQTVKDLLVDLRSLKQEVEVETRLGRYAQPAAGRPKAATWDGPAAADALVTRTADGGAAHAPSSAEYLVTEFKRHKRGAVAGLTVVVVAAAVYSYFLWGGKPAIDSVAIMPLTNVGADPNTEYLSDGITETLINRLSQLRDVKVIARGSVFRYKGREIDPQAVGRELGVRAVLTGRVVQRGDGLLISVELVDVQDNHQLWGEQYNRQLSDIFAVQEEITKRIAEELRLRLSSEEREQLAKSDTANVEAYQLYIKGRYFWNKRSGEGMRQGVGYFRQAIDVDPAYALAHVGLADSYNFLGAFGIAVLPPGEAMPKAKAAAMKALELDDSLAEAHTSLAFFRLYYERDWAAAEREFRRAIELKPNYPQAHQWYSHLLMASGRTAEAISKANRTVELDPLSLPAHLNLGWQYHWARQPDAAVEHLRKLLEMDPYYEQGRWILGLAYEQKGMFEEAAAEFRKAADLSGGNPVYVAALAHAYALMGKRAEAMRILGELEESSRSRYVPPYWVATAYAGLGERERAFNWLEKAYEERSGGLIWLGVDPRMDGLRADPRFADLVRGVGLPR